MKVVCIQTIGFNPFFHSEEFIINELRKNFNHQIQAEEVKKIFFYGIVKKNENISKKIFLTVLKWLKIKTFQTTPKIFLKKTKLNNNKNIIIGIGSSGITRRWPLENFTKLIKLINGKKKYNFYQSEVHRQYILLVNKLFL